MAATPPTAAVAVMEAEALAKGRQLQWLHQVCNRLELSHASTLYCKQLMYMYMYMYAANISCTCIRICMQQIAHVHVRGMLLACFLSTVGLFECSVILFARDGV